MVSNCIKCHRDTSYIPSHILDIHEGLCPICYMYRLSTCAELSLEDFIKDVPIQNIDTWYVTNVFNGQALRPKMRVKCWGEKPSYANEYAAGLDIRSNQDILMHPGQIIEFKTKLALEIPKGYCGLLTNRSGMSYNDQILLVSHVWIIDEDARGEIGLKLINTGNSYYQIKKGDRIAQIVLVPYLQPILEFVDELTTTERGTGGFGHTGR